MFLKKKIGRANNCQIKDGIDRMYPVNKDSKLEKEVFQPHLPVRLPCYDLAPVTGFTLDSSP